METALIITLGSRDIQLSKQVKNLDLRQNRTSNLFELKSNRIDGKYLKENFDEIKDLIKYPIIQPAIDWSLQEFEKLNKLVIICTDQKNNKDIDDRFKNNDTIETANLLKLILIKDYGHKVQNIKILPISKGVVFYDEMYDFFNDKFNEKILRFNTNDNVILFAQGGIDAINTALTLKCIETYPHTVQLNKPENSKSAFPLNFPQKFIKNFTKQQILHDLENFNYSAISNLNFDNKVVLLADYAFARASFDFDKAEKIVNKLLSKDSQNRAFYTKLSNEIKFDNSSFFERQKEAYLSAKLKLHQKAYADFLVQIFSLAENLLKPKVSEILGGEIVFNDNNNHKLWNNLINKKNGLKSYLSLQKINGYNLIFTKPNRAAFKCIVNFYFSNISEENKLSTMINNIEELTKLRNKVAHELVKVNLKDINEYLKKTNSDIDKFINIADEYFKINDFGIYDQINKKIISLL